MDNRQFIINELEKWCDEEFKDFCYLERKLHNKWHYHGEEVRNRGIFLSRNFPKNLSTLRDAPPCDLEDEFYEFVKNTEARPTRSNITDFDWFNEITDNLVKNPDAFQLEPINWRLTALAYMMH